MKKFLLIMGVLFASQASAITAPAFCSGDNLDMQSDGNCFTTCSAVAEFPAAQLETGKTGICVGQATHNEFSLYQIALGQESIKEPLCTIWSGDFTVFNSKIAKGSPKNAGVMDLSSCSKGEYDVVFLTASRYEKYAGNTVFPDGSGSIVRTTSTFASDDETDYKELDAWLESSTSHSDDTKGYVRPSTGWNSPFNKLASTPSAANLNGETDKTMLYDWVKIMTVGDTDVREGWACGDSYDCERAVGEDKRENLAGFEEGITEGLPLIIADGDVTLSAFDISYTSSVRGSTEEAGTMFLWHNDGGTLKYLGSRPHDDGLYITFGTPQSF
jgi:hypothetical protein